MKILTITDSFPPENVGGAGQVAFDLSLGLKQRGNNVVVVTTTQNRNNSGEELIDGLRIIRLYSEYPFEFLRSYVSVCNPFLKSKIKKIIKKEKPEIVHFHNVHQFISFAALKWAKKGGAKVFLTAHDVMLYSQGKVDNDSKISTTQEFKQHKLGYNPLRNPLIKRYLKNVDKIITVSDALKKALSNNGINNTVTIYNGVNVNDFLAAAEEINEFKTKFNLEGKKIIFFGGRGMGTKGPESLVNTLPVITKSVPNAVLIMAIAHNKYYEHMKNIINIKKLDNYVVLPGLLKGKQLAAMFGASDVVVVPSLYFDPCPLMNMQAMAASKPVVGTCFGGTPEIVVDNKTGYIVNPNNEELLANKIIDLLTNKEKAEDFGKEGFKTVSEKFSIQKQVENIMNLYKSCLNE